MQQCILGIGNAIYWVIEAYYPKLFVDFLFSKTVMIMHLTLQQDILSWLL
jgi:hypothetical protein